MSCTSRIGHMMIQRQPPLPLRLKAVKMPMSLFTSAFARFESTCKVTGAGSLELRRARSSYSRPRKLSIQVSFEMPCERLGGRW